MAKERKNFPSGIATELVAEYLERKTLAELGYKLDLEELTCWEAEAFTIIQAAINGEIAKRQTEAIEKAKRKRR